MQYFKQSHASKTADDTAALPVCSCYHHIKNKEDFEDNKSNTMTKGKGTITIYKTLHKKPKTVIKITYLNKVILVHKTKLNPTPFSLTCL